MSNTVVEKINNQKIEELKKEAEAMQFEEVEGYDQCYTVYHQCMHDCVVPPDSKVLTSNR